MQSAANAFDLTKQSILLIVSLPFPVDNIANCCRREKVESSQCITPQEEFFSVLSIHCFNRAAHLKWTVLEGDKDRNFIECSMHRFEEEKRHSRDSKRVKK